MKMKNWTVCVQDRGKWRDVVENEVVTPREEE
jgi:hypothetical protein